MKHNVYESYHPKVGMMLKNLSYSFRYKGFTLIEPIVVIILLGIMSVSVLAVFLAPQVSQNTLNNLKPSFEYMPNKNGVFIDFMKQKLLIIQPDS
jgi:prepilin-type N-terminal cleavage/methylation domain-containing protein